MLHAGPVALESAVVTSIIGTIGVVVVALITAAVAPAVSAWAKRKFEPTPPVAALAPASSVQDATVLDYIARLARVEQELEAEERRNDRSQRRIAVLERQVAERDGRIDELERQVAALTSKE